MTTRKTELGLQTVTENTTFGELDEAISDNATITTTELLDHNRRIADIQARIAGGELSGPERDQLVADLNAAVATAAQISDESISGVLADPETQAGTMFLGKSDTGHKHASDDLTDATTTGKQLIKAAGPISARAAIGAGTSSLTIGTSGTTAMAGNKTFTKADVGLGNVDNTSDLNKPVSTAVAAKLADVDPFQHDILNLRLGLRDYGIQNIVVLGSSTSDGVGASTPDNAYTSILSRNMHAAYPLRNGGAHPPRAALGSHRVTGRGIQVVIGALGGTTSANYADATKRTAVAASNPAAVLHMIGANDQAEGMDPLTYYSNIKTVIDSIDAQCDQPVVHVLIHSFRRSDVVSPVYPDSTYRDKLAQLATEAPATRRFIDVSPPFNLAGIPGPDPYGLKSDSIHVGDNGHQIIADTIRDALHIPKTSHDGGVWRDLIINGGVAARDAAEFRPQYLVDGNVVRYRGGVKFANGAAWGAANYGVAFLPLDNGSQPGVGDNSGSLFPQGQVTAHGATSTRDPAVLFVNADGSIFAWPKVSGATYIMFDNLTTPLKNL